MDPQSFEFPELTEAGLLTRTHGHGGGLLLVSDVYEPEFFIEKAFLFVEIDGQMVPWAIREAKIRGNGSTFVAFRDVPDETAARKFTQHKVFVEVAKKSAGQRTRKQFKGIEGYTVQTVDGTVIGKATELLELPGNPLLCIEADGEEILIPAHEDLIVGVDPRRRIIHIDVPEGLVDLNR